MRLISIVIPVYNEDRVQELLDKLKQNLDCRYKYEILVVDDGSDEISTCYMPGVHSFRYIVDSHRGRGSALRLGMLRTTGDIVVWMDADLEHDPSDLGAIIEPIASGVADIVIGNRFLNVGARCLDTFGHRFGMRLLTIYNSLFCGNDLGDAACGFRAFTSTVNLNLLDSLQEYGWGIDHEFVAKISHRGYRIYEVPVKYVPRTKKQGKKIRLIHGLQALWIIAKYNLREKLATR